MKENVLKEILLQGTQLVKKISINEIDLETFLKQYNNFYYYNALDGHEGDDLTISLLKKYSDVISFHNDIQTSVVDLIYFGVTDSLSKDLDTGRISADDGKKLIDTIAKKYDIDTLLSQLKE